MNNQPLKIRIISALMLTFGLIGQVGSQVVTTEIDGSMAPNEIPTSEAIYVYFRLIDGLNDRGRGEYFLANVGLNSEAASKLLAHVSASMWKADTFNKVSAHEMCSNSSALETKDALIEALLRRQEARIELFQGFFDETASVLDEENYQAFSAGFEEHKSRLRLTLIDFEAMIRSAQTEPAQLLDNVCSRLGPFGN